MTPEDFEKQIARIVSLIEGKGASVTWNKHIPDPDNPDQSRQIDIEIRKDNKIIHVECRHRKSPQDVTWVETLLGRKKSLGADTIIGVSSSGFTTGAIRKAKAKNIILRDLEELDDTDVFFWVGDLTLFGTIFTFSSLVFTFSSHSDYAGKFIPSDFLDFLSPESRIWGIVIEFLNRLSVTKLKSDLISNSTYLVEFDLDFEKNNFRLDGIYKLNVTAITKYVLISASRKNQTSFRSLNGESISIDAIIEGKQMPQWEIEVIQTPDKIGLLLERSKVGVRDNSIVTSTIKIDHDNIENKEIHVVMGAPKSLDQQSFTYSARVITPSGDNIIMV